MELNEKEEEKIEVLCNIKTPVKDSRQDRRERGRERKTNTLNCHSPFRLALNQFHI